jgi:microcystin-dependent protein
MADPFVAEIRIFPFNFAPTGWAFCNGQLLPISQNTALFSLLGTFYGGDGKSTFALPNLQGNVPMHTGQGPGLSDHFLGETGGSEFVTLIQSEMPAHSHPVNGTFETDDSTTPVGHGYGQQSTIYRAPNSNPASVLVQMAPESLAPNGGSLPHNNMMPYLTLNFCIALQGVFPPRT